MKKVKIALLILLTVILILGVVGLRISFRSSDDKLKDKFEKNNVIGDVSYFIYKDYTVRYAFSGNTESDLVFLFVHGAPGSLDMFNSYLMDEDLREAGLVVSVDRPGYGYSDYGNAEVSIINQAEILDALVRDKFQNKTVKLIGHSLGAPIVAYMAHINTRQINEIILAGGAVDPNNERFIFTAQFCDFAPIRMISGFDTKVATDEKLAHVDELIKIEHIWSKLQCKVIVQHGTEDWLVPYVNVEYLQKRVNEKFLVLDRLEGKGHLFIMNKDIVKSRLIQKIDN